MVQVSPPMVRTRAPLQLLVTNLDYDEHKGRICIGRVTSGKISKAESVAIAKPGAAQMLETATPLACVHCGCAVCSLPTSAQAVWC